LITETFSWPRGAILDWNYSNLYIDCMKLRRKMEIAEQRNTGFSAAEEKSIDNLIAIYDTYD